MNYINVYLYMPISPDRDELTWIRSLKIPVQSIIPLSLRPFKLIRYICFTLLSAHGELSLYEERPVLPIPYDSAIPLGRNFNVYYHFRLDEQSTLFPLGPRIYNHATTASSEHSRQADFKNLVAERDGYTCVVTNMGRDYCEASHLIALRKGDQYIDILTEGRSRNHSHPVHIEDINDIRNGLFLSQLIHGDLDRNYIGFLPLPNEYMSRDDVDPTLPDRSYMLHDLRSDDQRLNPARQAGIPHLSPLRISSQNWPPDILFDAVYASLVMKVWKTGRFEDHVNSGWTSEFYGGTPVNLRDGGHARMQEERTQASQRRQAQNQSRGERYRRRNEAQQSTEPDSMDLVMALQWLVHGVRTRPNEQETSECPQSVQSKVQEWLGTSDQFETGFV